MAIVRLKIDVAGTMGDEAWRQLRHFDEIQSATFGTQFGYAGPQDAPRSGCGHSANVLHPKGEWVGAEIRLQTPLLAQYAVAHYLEQDRVLDADVVE
jgi:hypothetical protein